MPKKFDRVGCIYGKLTVIASVGRNQHKQRLWLCQCACGETTVVAGGSLTTGNTKSCGCGEGYIKHGAWKKSSYHSWRAMMRRCYNPKDKDHVKYGAIGIMVQDSWHDYLRFAEDMGEPEGAQTLHRIDPYGNYTKTNCEWATPTVQARVIRLPKNNKTGYIGVRFRQGRYTAEITAKRKKYYGKSRASLEEAVIDRKQLEALYWGANG